MRLRHLHELRRGVLRPARLTHSPDAPRAANPSGAPRSPTPLPKSKGMTVAKLFTYHHVPAHLIRPDDEIKSADGKSWLPPVTKVDTHSRPTWTKLWWSTRPTAGTVSRPDLERPSESRYRVRRPRPNHEVTAAQVADEFARHGCRITVKREKREFRAVRANRHSATLNFYYDEERDTDVFQGAYIGGQWVRNLDVVRRHLGVPTCY